MLDVSGPGPFGDQPFGDLSAMIEGLLRSLGAAGQLDWDGARSMAAGIANEGVSEPNVDPSVRLRIEQFARVVEMHVEEVTSLPVSTRNGGIHLAPSTRTAWTAATVDAYRGLFEHLAESIGSSLRRQLDELDEDDVAEMGEVLPPGLGADPQALVAGLRRMMGPMMTTSMAGSTVGHLGSRAFGDYDLPIPRPATADVHLVVANIDRFGEEWSLPLDDLRMWICLHEVAHHAVLGIPHVASRMLTLLTEHASAFDGGFGELETVLGDVDMTDPSGMEQIQRLMSDPEAMFGAIRSTRQRELVPHIDALVAAVEGYVDWVLDEITAQLLPSASMITEAVRRRRVTADQASRFVERLFGLELTQPKLDTGSAFIEGVVQRAGTASLRHLWDDPAHLPTPAEIEAPGLWLARVDPDAAGQLPDAGGVDIPDFPDLDA